LDQELRFAAASPYEGDEFPAAAQALSDCDIIVMHCMGYTEAQRTSLVALTGKPVLLARRLVGAGIAQIL
jgi:protein AroM